MWFRDSPLVSASHVTVEGESGPDAAQIRAALESAAHTMSTLDVEHRAAAQRGRAVSDRQGHRASPRSSRTGMRIDVVEQLAVGAIEVGGRKVAVAPDGTLLHDLVVSGSLPTIPLRVAPAGARVTGASAAGRDQAAGGGACAELLPKISQVTHGHRRTGWWRSSATVPSMYFGDTTELSREMDGGVRGARRRRVGRALLHRRHRPGASRRLGRRQRRPEHRGRRSTSSRLSTSSASAAGTRRTARRTSAVAPTSHHRRLTLK